MKRFSPRPNVEVGGSNIFAGLGLPNADPMLLKSMIAIELRRHMIAALGDQCHTTALS
jgi:hypothetical protein